MSSDPISVMMATISESLQSLDWDRLSQKYQKRRNGFIKMLENSQHHEIKSRLLYAVVSTDVCVGIYQDFFTSLANKAIALEKSATTQVANYQAANDEIIKAYENLIKEVQTRSQDSFTESYLNSVQTRQAFFEFVGNQRKELVDLSFTMKAVSLYIIAMSATSSYDSLSKLLEINDLSLVGDILVVVVKSLIGIFPPGSVATFLWDLYEVSKKQAEQYRQASDLLTQLDNYSDTIDRWCILIQMLIEISEERLSIDIQNGDPGDINLSTDEISNISRLVDNRFEDFLHRMNSNTSTE